MKYIIFRQYNKNIAIAKTVTPLDEPNLDQYIKYNLFIRLGSFYSLSLLGYIGCFVDDSERQLKNKENRIPDLTLEICRIHCKGYTYLGLRVIN